VIARALTIAGSDPTGGSGVQQDIRTFTMAGVWGLSVVTALTVQDARGVHAVTPVAASSIVAQLAAAARLGPDAAKTGLLPNVEAVEAVARASIPSLVIDPVLTSSSGHRLAGPDVAEALVAELLPRARLITPNAHEASVLTGIDVVDRASQLEAARALSELGTAALVTGGHIEGEEVIDVLVHSGEFVEFAGPRIDGPAVRGTGCRLSAGIVAMMAQGADLAEAITGAIGWVRRGIEGASEVGGIWVLGGF